jgi:hypothetical protein
MCYRSSRSLQAACPAMHRRMPLAPFGIHTCCFEMFLFAGRRSRRAAGEEAMESSLIESCPRGRDRAHTEGIVTKLTESRARAAGTQGAVWRAPPRARVASHAQRACSRRCKKRRGDGEERRAECRAEDSCPSALVSSARILWYTSRILRNVCVCACAATCVAVVCLVCCTSLTLHVAPDLAQSRSCLLYISRDLAAQFHSQNMFSDLSMTF